MDTKLAIITNLAMGTGLAFAVASLARRLSNSTMNALSGVCVLLMLSHVLASRETLLLANILPSETLMFFGQPVPTADWLLHRSRLVGSYLDATQAHRDRWAWHVWHSQFDLPTAWVTASLLEHVG